MSALLFTPWPLGIVLIAPHAGRWADTISAPAISTLGLVIFVVGLILLATLPAQTFNVGYLPAKSGMRNRVWLLSESQ